MRRLRVDYGDDDLNDLIERLRPKLLVYLANHNVLPEDFDPNQPEKSKFCCIHPDHPDKNPSMTVVKTSEGTRVRCWSQNHGADIFQAAAWLEGKPESGPDWVKENVYYLARLLEEPYKEHVLTPEQMAKAQVLKLYADATDVLVGLSKTSKKFNGFEHTRKRGLKDEACAELGIGTVDFDEFVDTLEQYGPWEREYILSTLPYNPGSLKSTTDQYFGRQYITIALRNERGVIVGFDRRYVPYNQEDAAQADAAGKFYPQKFRLPVKSTVFDPDTYVYGIYESMPNNWKTAYVVEGYFDRVALYQAGIDCCMSTRGTGGFGKSHANVLVKNDFRDVCFVYDSDQPGRLAMERTLKEVVDISELRVSFKMLGWRAEDKVPDHDKDPHTFMMLYCQKNTEQFDKMPVHSAFRLSLALEAKKGTKGEELVRTQIGLLAQNTDAMERGRMIRDLAKTTGVPEADIREAVHDILSRKGQEISKELVRDLSKPNMSPKELQEALAKASMKMSPLFGGNMEAVSRRAAKGSFFKAIEAFYSHKGVLAGYRTGIPYIDDNLSGVRRNVFWVVAGNPNSGKSALLHCINHGILQNIADNKDVCTIMFSMDDPSEWAWAKMIALHCGLPIPWCAEPHKYILGDKVLTRKYQDAQAFYRDLLDDHCWVLGGDQASDLRQMQRAIKNAQDATGRHVVAFVDSFNKMHAVDGLEGTAKFEKNAEGLHDLTHLGVAVIVSAETVKSAQGKKPTMQDVADTKKITFNPQLVTLLYNPLHEDREKAQHFWVAEDKARPGKFRKSAVVQIDMWKNKINSYKESSIFKFHDEVGHFEQITDIRSFMAAQYVLWGNVGDEQTLQKNTGLGGSVPFIQFDE